MARLLKDLSVDLMESDVSLRQVIVNTHSPVLVSQLINWREDKNVSVWLSRLHTLVTDTDRQRIKTKITRMSFVENKNTQLPLFPISEAERKLTLAEVIEYLKTTDTESAIKAIQ